MKQLGIEFKKGDFKESEPKGSVVKGSNFKKSEFKRNSEVEGITKESIKVVAFDVWGDYAHFRCFFTTASPLTYSFPPPTAIRGMIGAVLGLGKKEYLRATADLYVGIRLLNPARKVRWGQSIVNTKRGNDAFDPTLFKKVKAKNAPRSLIKIEYLRNPKYRIYVGGDSPLLDDLKILLENHQNYYTVYLGISELIASFAYAGSFKGELLSSESCEIHSVFPKDVLDPERGLQLILESDVKLVKERVPVCLSVDREPLLYQDVVVEVRGKPVKVVLKGNSSVYRLNDGEVVYLWPPASTLIRESC